MATMFIQQSNEYIKQIEAEIERLQQLRDQVRTTIQSEEQLEIKEPGKKTVQKRAAKKAVEPRSPSKKVAAKKRGRPKTSAVQA